MSNPDNENFIRIWPKCFIILTGVIELIAVLFLFLTELGSVSAQFWYGNVFAGAWCGLVMAIHMIFVFMAGCSPSHAGAYRTMIVSVLAAVASTALIAFDTVFLINSKICIMTPSCTTYATSNATFADSLQSSFISTFRRMDLFKSYTESQSKTLFQAIQVGLGGVCLLMSISFIFVFYNHDKRAKEQVRPALLSPPAYHSDNRPSAQNLYPSFVPGAQQYPAYGYPPIFAPGAAVVPPSAVYGPNATGAWPRRQVHVAQAPPGQIPWNGTMSH